MWLTRLAFRNSIAILMLSLAITVLGIVSLRRLPVDLFPRINLPIVRVGHHLHGRRRQGHREEHHLSDREGGQLGERRRSRRVALQARHLGRAGVVQLGRQPRHRRGRGRSRRSKRSWRRCPPASSSRSSSSSTSRTSRCCWSPSSGEGYDEKAALRHRLQHRRAAARAPAARRLGERRGRQDPPDHHRSGPRRDPSASASASTTSSTPSPTRTCILPRAI